MRIIKFIFFLTTVFIAPLLLAGCISIKTKQNTGPPPDGGVFKTINKGMTWQQVTLIPTTSGKPKSFSMVNAASMAIDPSDKNAIYFGSRLNGLFYTFDGGNTWTHVNQIGNATINDIAIDPESKCTIYVAIANRVYKSSDCNRSWEQVYYDNNVKAVVTEIDIDHYDSNNVYIVINRGEIIKSMDRGKSWQVLKRFNEAIAHLIIDPNDSRIFYVSTPKNGIYRSKDSGISWGGYENLNSRLKELKLGFDIKDFILVKEHPEVTYVATFYGLLTSVDYGQTWNQIELIQPNAQATIKDMVVNPQNIEEIFYVTNTTFFRSEDGGQHWTMTKLPSTRKGVELLIDPIEPNILYLGVL